MSTYDPRTPLENGTVLRTMDGKTFHILRFTAASGNALLMRPGWMAARWT